MFKVGDKVKFKLSSSIPSLYRERDGMHYGAVYEIVDVSDAHGEQSVTIVADNGNRSIWHPSWFYKDGLIPTLKIDNTLTTNIYLTANAVWRDQPKITFSSEMRTAIEEIVKEVLEKSTDKKIILNEDASKVLEQALKDNGVELGQSPPPEKKFYMGF